MPRHKSFPYYYTALSHKWGDSAFLKLTSSNIQQLQLGNMFDLLPEVFKDAVIATRLLGIRYLWIDSICILQDSHEDWLEESRTMDLVYSNAYCNLAASESHDPNGHMLKMDDSIHSSPIRIRALSHSIDEDYFLFYDMWSRRWEKPLSKRGWVVQERLLSPRTIHFGSPSFWECRRMVACETYPQGLLSYKASPSEKIWPGNFANALSRNPLDVWEYTLETYTSCSLSKEHDKLVAISGIARMLQPFIQSDYLAGLWRKHLLRGLLWFVEKDREGYSKAYERVDTFRGKNTIPQWFQLADRLQHLPGLGHR